ncbi:LppA family lipoprotein [Mycobacteroides chelonae]
MNNPDAPTPTTEATKALEELKSLPTLEDTNEKLTTSIQQLGAKISALVPSVTWHWQDEPQRIGCSKPYEQSDGKVILMPFYVSDVPIPESRWNEVLAAAKETAAAIDTPKLDVIHDAPNNHDVRFSNETGTAIALTSQVNTVISGYTGCRLPAAKK